MKRANSIFGAFFNVLRLDPIRPIRVPWVGVDLGEAKLDVDTYSNFRIVAHDDIFDFDAVGRVRPDPILRLHDCRAARLARESAGNGHGDERTGSVGVLARGTRRSAAQQERATKP